MERQLFCLGGAGFGAAVMYLFDPDLGARRRAMLRDRLVANIRRAQGELEKGCRDAQQRAQGFFHEIRQQISGSGHGSDEVLVGRVRSKLGRYVSHPRAIDVEVADGCVELSGPILAGEVEGLFEAVRKVPGVRHVDNHLEVHDSAEGISALQGGRAAVGERWNIREANWAPATRLTMASAGGVMLAYGIHRRSVVGCAMGAIALGLAGARAKTNVEPRRAQRRTQPGPKATSGVVASAGSGI